MEIFVVTVIIFGAAMAAMAVGVIFSDRQLQGSCGGTGEDCSCSAEARQECALAAEYGSD